MPIPSASSKIFWPCSIFFEHEQKFLTMIKSDILPYRFAYLSMVKNIWPHSKNIERGQKILNATNFFFELADGLGICIAKKKLWDKNWTKDQLVFYQVSTSKETRPLT